MGLICFQCFLFPILLFPLPCLLLDYVNIILSVVVWAISVLFFPIAIVITICLCILEPIFYCFSWNVETIAPSRSLYRFLLCLSCLLYYTCINWKPYTQCSTSIIKHIFTKIFTISLALSSSLKFPLIKFLFFLKSFLFQLF